AQAAARMAGRRASRAVGDPEHRVLLAFREHPGGSGRVGRETTPPRGGAGGSGAKPPDVPAWAARDYGNRIGVFRLMKVLDRYGVRGTAALNSDLCAQHPEIIEECKARKWEFMGHNESNTRRLNELRAGRESRTIRGAL